MRQPSAPAPLPRRPGRPAGRNRVQRDPLLDIAVSHCARAGMAQLTLRDIATLAQVTPALLAYYFGSRDGLRKAVVEERVIPAIVSLRGVLDAAPDEPLALAAAFVEGVHALVRAHPWLPALWVREVLTEGGALRAAMLTEVAPHIPHVLAARFARAQQRGQLSSRLDPRLLMVSLLGLTLFPLAAEPVWRQVFDDPDLHRNALRQHTLALVEAALETPHAP